jgi:hypothetical protein
VNDPYTSKDWRIRVSIDWVLKDDVVKTIDCKRCNGQGRFSSFGYLGFDEENDLRCDTCWGKGQVPNPDIEDKPPMPEVFVNYMRGYFKKFFDMLDEREKKHKLNS